MTPAEAARILGCTAGASRADIDLAYRKRARETHPDRFAGQSPEVLARAAVEFARVGEAYALLVAVPPTALAEPTRRVTPPYPRAFVYGWAAVLALGDFLSYTGDARLLGDLEFAVRLAALTIGLVGYALTGRRALLVAATIALAVTVVSTLAAAAFGSLLALFVIAPAAIGLLLAGRREAGRG